MSPIRPILCTGISFLFLTTLAAQESPQKNKIISNVAFYHPYQQKLWNIKQLPKNLVLYQFNSTYNFHRVGTSIAAIDNWHLFQPPTISEKLQLHVQKSLLQPYYIDHLLYSTSCWDPIFFIRYKAAFSNKTFFKYQ